MTAKVAGQVYVRKSEGREHLISDLCADNMIFILILMSNHCGL